MPVYNSEFFRDKPYDEHISLHQQSINDCKYQLMQDNPNITIDQLNKLEILSGNLELKKAAKRLYEKYRSASNKAIGQWNNGSYIKYFEAAELLLDLADKGDLFYDIDKSIDK